MVDYTAGADRTERSHDTYAGKAVYRASDSTGANLFQPETFAKVAGITILCLVVLSSLSLVLASSSDGLVSRIVVKAFSLDREENLPTFASFVLLVLSAVLTATVGWRQYRSRDRWWRHWCALAGLMLFIAYDEAAGIHERLSQPMRNYFDIDPDGVLYLAWVIPAAAIVAVLTVVFLPFVLSLPTRVRNLTVAAAACYVSGALGMELIGSAFYEGYSTSGAIYYAVMTAEETLEMTGLMLFCTAMLAMRRRENPARS